MPQSGGGGGGGGGGAAPKPKPAAAAAASSSAPKSKAGGGAGGSFIHKLLPKTKAEEMLTAHNGGACKDGTFLFRQIKSSGPNAYVLSVIYRGKPTHHQCTREDKGGDWTINKHACAGITTIKALANHLKAKKAGWWPVALAIPVTGGGGSGAAKPKPKPKAAASSGEAGASGDSSAGSGAWLLEDITSKAAAATRLASECGDAPKSGMFVCWPRPKVRQLRHHFGPFPTLFQAR